MAAEVTVVGGGLAGLVAAIGCAEAGVTVTLHEAHGTLGGRARATQVPYVAHTGPHVFYADGPHWTWLRERKLIPPLGRPPLLTAARLSTFRFNGKLGRRAPAGLLRMIVERGRSAPVDQDFHSWASARYGATAAVAAANAISVATYDANTGRLSAAFVWGLFHRVFAPKPPAVRWVVGGWQAVIDRLVERAEQLGVRIELRSRVTQVNNQPTIVATELSSARALFGDNSLTWTSGDCVLLDVAVPRSGRDMFLVFDLDEGGFHECYSLQDGTVAPEGEALFQLDLPRRPGEANADAHRRLERLAELAVPEWRSRATWRRAGTARDRTGALDLPGQTWRDRPAIDRGDGVFLAGDMVAAPGMRGEISINSAVRAAHGALRLLGKEPVGNDPFSQKPSRPRSGAI
ncbi:phytoene dehydrogenase-like protein [Tamaricihabitans halophyticus]|uniref:Phytoene dehydrogenase-like protein n=1 Tax=Tamaricihabitans halophyticus TaxID=1262583 RepID=A0A4R2QMJ2_9PSEU|nr:FAD-dependent oxidoreductase [Tamaricihabitans halophyticus]TCP50770.1 phytoene dehydrogenase-like protein [Tamaricihabitans halophyticus]